MKASCSCPSLPLRQERPGEIVDDLVSFASGGRPRAGDDAFRRQESAVPRRFSFSPRTRGEGARSADEGLRGLATTRFPIRPPHRSRGREAPHPALRATFSPPARGEGRVFAAVALSGPECGSSRDPMTVLPKTLQAAHDFPRTLLPLRGRGTRSARRSCAIGPRSMGGAANTGDRATETA